jgi:hypothetical protein
MHPRTQRLLTLLGLVFVTWLLLAHFIWRFMAASQSNTNPLPWGAVAFAAYLLTISYGGYYRRHWATSRSAKPGSVNWRHLPPMARWVLTMVAAGGLCVGVALMFPSSLTTFGGQLVLLTATFAVIGTGMVLTSSGAEHGASEPESPPTFVAATLGTVGWQVYGFLGAAALFGPAYLVMDGFRTYVDVPACQNTCVERGYTYENLVTKKTSPQYSCNCRGPSGRITFHERANIGGGNGFLAAAFDCVVRMGAVLVAIGGCLTSLLAFMRLAGDDPKRLASKFFKPAASIPVLPPKKSRNKGTKRKRR